MNTENPPRHEVAVFARAMESVLKANDRKGRRIDQVDPEYCLQRLWDEARELDRVAFGRMHGNVSRGVAERIQRETTDVANFCAMIWWAMEGTEGKESPHIAFMGPHPEEGR